MKFNLFLSNRVQTTLYASMALAMLPASLIAFPAPRWMQGGHAARITGIASSPNGAMIASASEDGTIKIWSTNGTLLNTITNQNTPITALAWSPDGTKIASGSYLQGTPMQSPAGKGVTYLWQSPSGTWLNDVSLLLTKNNNAGFISALAFTSDGASLASGSVAGSNLVYSVATGNLVTSRPAYNYTVYAGITNGRAGMVMSVAFSSSGLMASGCEESSIRVYDSSWNSVWNSTNTPGSHKTNVTSVAFSPDGTLLATASLDQTIKIWATAGWTLQQTITGTGTGVVSVAFSPNGQRIVSGSEDGKLAVWGLDGVCRLTIPAHALPITSALFSKDGASIISASDDCTVRIWSAADGSPICNLGGQNSYIGAVTFSPDGTLCASAAGQAIQIRNATNGALVRTLPGHTVYVSALAFSPDSATIASGGGPLEPTIKLWSISTGVLLQTINATTNGVMALAWSPDGSTLACGADSVEQSIKLWTPSGTLVQTLAGHTNGVTALAFSPDSTRLASGGRRFDNTIKVWDLLNNGALLSTFTGHSNNIECLAFSPDGNLIASGSSATTNVTSNLKVWQLSNSSVRGFGTGTNPVCAVAFSADGSTLASSDRESIKFWNVAAATVTETVTQNAFRVTSMAFSPNANLFLYGREDGTLLLSPNTYGAMGQPALTFVAPIPGSQMGVSASVQPSIRYIIQYSTDLNAGWNYATQGSSPSNTWNITIPPRLPISAEDNVFLRALTPQ